MWNTLPNCFFGGTPSHFSGTIENSNFQDDCLYDPDGDGIYESQCLSLFLSKGLTLLPPECISILVKEKIVQEKLMPDLGIMVLYAKSLVRVVLRAKQILYICERYDQNVSVR